MTDSSSSGADANSSDTTPCQYCGNEYQPRGVAAHECHCEENPEIQSGSDGLQSGQTKSGAGAMETPLEARALERDGCECRRCVATGDPDIVDIDVDWSGDAELTVEPLVPGDTVDALSDLVTLCSECAEILDGFHYLTKRTKVLFK
jgi:hypothetical protein